MSELRAQHSQRETRSRCHSAYGNASALSIHRVALAARNGVNAAIASRAYLRARTLRRESSDDAALAHLARSLCAMPGARAGRVRRAESYVWGVFFRWQGSIFACTDCRQLVLRSGVIRLPKFPRNVRRCAPYSFCGQNIITSRTHPAREPPRV